MDTSEYVQDGNLRGFEELGRDCNGIPADWHVEFKHRGHYVCVQFGSRGVTREVAQQIADGIRSGLTNDWSGETMTKDEAKKYVTEYRRSSP